jgi:hypothetical protein
MDFVDVATVKKSSRPQRALGLIDSSSDVDAADPNRY